MLRDNRLDLNYSEITSSSSFICFSITSNEFPVRKRFVSSANMIVWSNLDA